MAAMIGGLKTMCAARADEDVDIAISMRLIRSLFQASWRMWKPLSVLRKEYGIGRAMMLNVAAHIIRVSWKCYVKLEKVLADVPMQAPRFP